MKPGKPRRYNQCMDKVDLKSLDMDGLVDEAVRNRERYETGT